MTPQAAHSLPLALTRRETVCFGILFLLLLAPALLNGFPLVMSDSIAYSGQGVHWMRGKSAAVLLSLPFQLAGYWALPILTSAMNAGAWILLFRVFDIRPNLFVLTGLVCVSLQPLYTSAVLVDAWFFPAVVLLISSLRLPALFVGGLAGLLLSSHGSGYLLAIVFAVLAAVLCQSRKPVMASLCAAVVAFIFNLVLDTALQPDLPRLTKTFPAARAFSVQPELLRREAERSGNPVLAEAADMVEDLAQDPANAGRRDLFWDVWKLTEGRFDLAEFETEHAGAIFKDTFVYRPVELTGFILGDFLSFYAPDTEFDFLRRPSETFPPGFEASRQADGVFQNPAVQAASTAFRYACYLAFGAALIIGWRTAPAGVRMTVLGAIVLLLANDALFALLSGPPDRYHHRVLPLLAASALLLLSPRRTGDIRPASQVPA